MITIQNIQYQSTINTEPQTDYYPSYSNPDFDYHPNYYTSLESQQKSLIEQCFNEQGYYVNSSITVFTSVEDDVLRIKGSGIHYDSNFSDQAVISLSPVNDYDGTKDIHLVKVKNNNKFVGLFDINKVFYNDYVYGNTEYSGNIDSLGNYKIEVQYDDQCGFTYLEYYHRISTTSESKVIPEPTKNPTSESIDYSNSCIDEHHNFQESTINISASQTWVKESTIGSPISGNGIIKSGWSNSAILTILGSDGVGTSYEVPVKSDGTFWKFFETRDMFVDDSLYGNYLISVMYNDQCGEVTLDYMRGHPPSTTPTLEEVQESVEVVQEISTI